MKTTGVFAKIEQGLWKSQGVEYSKLSDKEVDVIADLLTDELKQQGGRDQKEITEIVDCLLEKHKMFLQKIKRKENQSLVATFLSSPNDLYEMLFPSLRKSTTRERCFIEFLSPTRAKMTLEYLVQKRDFLKENCDVAYVFTPKSHLFMLDVYVDSSKIGLIPHPKLKKYIMDSFREELADLVVIIEKASRGTSEESRSSSDQILDCLQNSLWERRGVSPVCIDTQRVSKQGEDSLFLIEVSYIDGFAEDVGDERCFIQKSVELWKEHEICYRLLPKTDDYPIWIFSKAPEKFHTKISLQSSDFKKTMSTEKMLKKRELELPSLKDPSFSAFRLTECLGQTERKKGLVSYDDNGIPVRISISVPQTLKRWLGFTFWISLLGTLFPLAIMVLSLFTRLGVISDPVFGTTILHAIQFLKANYATIALFILGLIITARGWLIYEETTFEPLSRKLTSLAILLLLVLITLPMV